LFFFLFLFTYLLTFNQSIMYRYFVFICLFCLFTFSNAVEKGVIQLDDISWDRIVDGSKPVLVAFTEWSWSDPKEYGKVSEEFRNSDVIVAKIAKEDAQKATDGHFLKKQKLIPLPIFQLLNFFQKDKKLILRHMVEVTILLK